MAGNKGTEPLLLGNVRIEERSILVERPSSLIPMLCNVIVVSTIGEVELLCPWTQVHLHPWKIHIVGGKQQIHMLEVHLHLGPLIEKEIFSGDEDGEDPRVESPYCMLHPSKVGGDMEIGLLPYGYFLGTMLIHEILDEWK
jgi:hypothetical protein